MPRPSKTKRLAAWMNGEKVGDWTIDAQGRHEFRYDETWLETDGTRPISLSMPLQSPVTPYRGEVVESFFDNLLPDSIDIRRRVRAKFGAKSTSAFDLLFEVGRDCAGAIQLLPEDKTADDVKQIDATPLDESGVANELRATVTSTALGQRESEEFRISIAGAQEKTALLWHKEQWHRPTGATPTTHIFKLPLGRVGRMQADLTTSVENEWICRQIVHEFGIPIAECNIADFEDQHVLVVKRFDRRLSRNRRWWVRLPQEDLCQATGTPPADKYESDGGPGISKVSDLLLGSRNSADDRRTFFKANVVFWLLCAIDGHAKNFSLFIEPGGRFHMTPLYDVLSAYPVLGGGRNQLAPQKARMAMAVAGANRHYRWSRIQPRHWLSTAAAVGLAATARDDLQQIAGRAPEVVSKVAEVLPTDFPARVSEPIFAGLLKNAKTLAALD